MKPFPQLLGGEGLDVAAITEELIGPDPRAYTNPLKRKHISVAFAPSAESVVAPDLCNDSLGSAPSSPGRAHASALSSNTQSCEAQVVNAPINAASTPSAGLANEKALTGVIGWDIRLANAYLLHQDTLERDKRVPIVCNIASKKLHIAAQLPGDKLWRTTIGCAWRFPECGV